MEHKAFLLRARRGGDVTVRVIPGHFATKHSHVNYCVDMTQVKSELKMARSAAKLFGESFRYTPVDTIITLERMKMVGAFLARDLYLAGINLGQDIAVITPEITDSKMLLRDNFIPYVKGKNVLLLTASASTGMTVAAAIEGIRYYGGEAVGAATIFGGSFQSAENVPVVKLFGVEDIPDYHSSIGAECPLCKAGVKIEAVVNSYGYSKII